MVSEPTHDRELHQWTGEPWAVTRWGKDSGLDHRLRRSVIRSVSAAQQGRGPLQVQVTVTPCVELKRFVVTTSPRVELKRFVATTYIIKDTPSLLGSLFIRTPQLSVLFMEKSDDG